MNRRSRTFAWARRIAATMAVACGTAVVVHLPLAAQTHPTPLERVRASGLDSLRVGRVTGFFGAGDRAYATELLSLADSAAAFMEREFGEGLPLFLAVLRPADWFVPYEGGDLEPYGMPWGWVPESLMAVPASLSEGVLVLGPDEAADARRVRFVMLHEFGHLAAKRHLHPDGPHPYSSVRWFEELLATYFAYSFIRATDPAWADAGLEEWTAYVGDRAPPSATLDWSFMFQLPPDPFAETYAWYQNLLNVRAADLHSQLGLDFLRNARSLPWAAADEWHTQSLLPLLETFSPGFEDWAEGLEAGRYFPD